jgi:hypothetical protein
MFNINDVIFYIKMAEPVKIYSAQAEPEPNRAGPGLLILLIKYFKILSLALCLKLRH